MSARARHLLPLMGFAALVALWLWPLAARIDSAVPGSSPGDNLTFVWNLWWMRYALQHAMSVWRSPLLFVPFGADLALHTHTAFEGAIGALVDPHGSIVRLQNVWIAADLYLNVACAYVLGWRLTRSVGAAAAGALLFGSCPFLSAHLPGHFNLIAAWVLPLAAAAALAVAERGSVRASAALAVVLAIAAYLDSYYFVYAAIAAAVLILQQAVAVADLPTRHRTTWRAVRAAMIACVLADSAVIGWILVSGGASIALGRHTLSMRSIANPLTAAWLAGAVAATASWRLSGRRVEIDGRRVRAHALRLAAIVVGAAVLMAPLVLHGAGLLWSGAYVSQPYYWRSAPAGIDLATFVLGNPFGAALASRVQPLYARLGINVVEQVAWIGPGVWLLAACGWRCRTREPAARAIAACGAAFFIWALGPWLSIAGRSTPLMLPVIAIRSVPIVANARMPGRAIVMVYLALSMLAAVGVRDLWQRGAGARLIALSLAALAIVDFWPVRPPLYTLDRADRLYAAIADGPPGTVLELPFGVRDGFGEVGDFDSRTLFYQTVHQHPIVGGFAARVPPAVAAAYRGMPVIGSLLQLSGGGALAPERLEEDRASAPSALAAIDVRYVVIDRARASADLVDYARNVLPLRPLASEGEREAYVVGSQKLEVRSEK